MGSRFVLKIGSVDYLQDFGATISAQIAKRKGILRREFLLYNLLHLFCSIRCVFAPLLTLQNGTLHGHHFVVLQLDPFGQLFSDVLEHILTSLEDIFSAFWYAIHGVFESKVMRLGTK